MSTNESPDDKNSRLKTIIRYLLHFIHFSVAVLLLVIIILDLISSDRTLLILYLLPLILTIFIIDICHLFRYTPPERITGRLGAFNTLRVRGFIYQGAAALAVTHGSKWKNCKFNAVYPLPGWGGRHFYVELSDMLLIRVRILGWVVWGIGVALFIIAVVAHELECLDWFEEPEAGIRLGQSSPRDDESARLLE